MKRKLLDFYYYKIIDSLGWYFCELSFKMGMYFSDENGTLDDILLDWIQYQFYKLGCYLYGLSLNYRDITYETIYLNEKDIELLEEDFNNYVQELPTSDRKKSITKTKNR